MYLYTCLIYLRKHCSLLVLRVRVGAIPRTGVIWHLSRRWLFPSHVAGPFRLERDLIRAEKHFLLLLERCRFLQGMGDMLRCSSLLGSSESPPALVWRKDQPTSRRAPGGSTWEEGGQQGRRREADQRDERSRDRLGPSGKLARRDSGRPVYGMRLGWLAEEGPGEDHEEDAEEEAGRRGNKRRSGSFTAGAEEEEMEGKRHPFSRLDSKGMISSFESVDNAIGAPPIAQLLLPSRSPSAAETRKKTGKGDLSRSFQRKQDKREEGEGYQRAPGGAEYRGRGPPLLSQSVFASSRYSGARSVLWTRDTFMYSHDEESFTLGRGLSSFSNTPQVREAVQVQSLRRMTA